MLNHLPVLPGQIIVNQRVRLTSVLPQVVHRAKVVDVGVEKLLKDLDWIIVGVRCPSSGALAGYITWK